MIKFERIGRNILILTILFSTPIINLDGNYQTHAQVIPNQSHGTKLLLSNGNIITMEPDNISYRSLLSTDGKISELTNSTSTLLTGDEPVKIVDVEGRTILPGFIDSHAHWIGDRGLTGMSADEIISLLLSYGWTSISEQFVNQDRLNELIDLDTHDRLKVRVNAFLPVNYQDQRFGTWYQAYTPFSMVSSKVRIGGVKFFMDNGPYFSHVNRSYWFTSEELNPMVQTVHDLGYQISIHSIMDNATDMALNAIEFAQGNNSDGTFRHRVEHASFLRDDQLVRLRDMNAVVSGQMLWYDSGETDLIRNHTDADPVPNLHLEVARWRDVIDMGIKFIQSTDTPWGLDAELGNSIKGLYRLTTRKGDAGLTPPDWALNQRITTDEAIRSITIDAAFGAFEEGVKGSLKPGKYSDLVVLSQNPFEMDPNDLMNLTVDMTIIGGEVVYCRSGLEYMCYTAPTIVSDLSSIEVGLPSTTTEILTPTPMFDLRFHFTWLVFPILTIFVSRKRIHSNK